MKQMKRLIVIGILALGALTAEGAIPTAERQALIDLYNSTNGAYWTDRTNWRNVADTDFNAPGTECTWYGVSCSGDTVTHLVLDDNGLQGDIPGSIGNLSGVEEIDLSNNELKGPIPPELAALSNLRDLYLSSNLLTGSIPPQLSDLSNLRDLELYFNLLTGSIPPQLGDLSNLQELVLAYNQLEGEIPPELAALQNLDMLELSSNQLEGTIPPELGQLPNLSALFLSDNQLSGKIPPELGNLPHLGLLYLDSNQLVGTIPPELSNPPYFRELHLADNRLCGAIPSSFGNFSQLSELALSGNQLRGEIPVELTNLTSLTSLSLDYNALWTTDSTVEAFLASLNEYWHQTQTVTPEDVAASPPTSSSIELDWTPIEYQDNTGYYAVFVDPPPPADQIFHDGFEGGDDEWWGIGNPWAVTTDKTASSTLVDGLESGTTYHFVIRTVTEANSSNQNQLISDPGATLTETTW